MKRLLVSLAAWLLLSCTWAHAGGCGRWGFGIGIGFPVFYPPCGGYYGYYYRPYPVYVAPPPVVVQPAPVIQSPPVVYQTPPPAPAPAQAAVRSPEVQQDLRLLSDPNERVRADVAIQLGRARSPQAVDPLAATLAGDRSPTVREAAARALGVIGSPHSLPALRQAAQNDPDRNVRYSAQFAIDVIEVR